MSGAGLDLTPPLSNQLSTQDIQGLFINQHVGYTQPSSSGTQNLQIVKREPEDLSHHRKLDNSSPSLDGSIIVSKQSRHKVRLLAITFENNRNITRLKKMCGCLCDCNVLTCCPLNKGRFFYF